MENSNLWVIRSDLSQPRQESYQEEEELSLKDHPQVDATRGNFQFPPIQQHYVSHLHVFKISGFLWKNE